MTKNQINRMLAITTKATQTASTDFEGMGEVEATTLVGMAYRKGMVSIVMVAAGCDEEAARAAITAATVEVDEALAAKKAKKNGTDDSDE